MIIRINGNNTIDPCKTKEPARIEPNRIAGNLKDDRVKIVLGRCGYPYISMYLSTDIPATAIRLQRA